MASRKPFIKFIFFAALLGVLVSIGKFTNLAQYASREFIQSFGIFAPLIYMLAYIIATIFFIPGSIITFIGAVLFGTWLGTTYTVIGATIGATLAFLIARVGGREFIEKIVKGRFITFDEGIEKNGFKINLIFRLVPLFPFNMLNFALGLTKIKVKEYVSSTFIGIIPGTFVYTYLFATLGEKILAGKFSMQDVLTFDVLLPISLFIALIVVSMLIKKKAGAISNNYVKKS